MQHLDKPKVGQVTIQRSSGSAATLLNRVYREHKRNAAGIADASLHALGRLDMATVARGDVATDLGDADDRLSSAQFLRRDAVVQETLDVNDRVIRMRRIVEPLLTAKPSDFFSGITHPPGQA